MGLSLRSLPGRRIAGQTPDAGTRVLYGLAGLKVHAKIALVGRREQSGKITAILRLQRADTQKAPQLRQDGTSEKVAAGRAEALRVQEYLYRQGVIEQQRMRSFTPIRFVPLQGID